jgi:hypothetical protein
MARRSYDKKTKNVVYSPPKPPKLERGVQVSIDLDIDDNGYPDRLCPSDECGTHFKSMFEDWRPIVRDEIVDLL